MSDARLVGDRALRLELPPGAPRRAVLAWLLAQPGVRDASLAAEHALVVFDGTPRPIAWPDAWPADRSPPVLHEVRVAYDGADLQAVATALGVGADEVIARHGSAAWEVAFLGFSPGFAYLVIDDPLLSTVARRASPRPRVPAGSVALAGGYTGVYPADTPGGWNLLGHAIDPRLLEGERPRFAVGDRVRFVRA
jgi:allophanate hydrolase subunit 1